MKLTINQLSKATGISADTLRYYKSLGLLHPLQNKENNYNYFGDNDVLQSIMIKRYRSLGMPIKGVQSTIEGLNPEEQSVWLSNRTKQLEQQIKLLEFELEHNKAIEKFTNMTIEKQGNVELFSWEQSVSSLYLFGKDYERPSEELIQSWSNAMPYTYPTLSISKEELSDENKIDSYNVKLGLAAVKDNVDFCGLSVEYPVQTVEGGLSVRMFLRVKNPFHIMPSDVKPMLDFVKMHNFNFAHDSTGWIIASDYEKANDYLILLRVRLCE